MGLLDVINGMMNGPRGPSDSAPTSGESEQGGMSPITMAILGVLAYQAMKHFGGGSGQQAPAPSGTGRIPGPSAGNPASEASGGGLADILSGGIGNILKGAASGGALGGGLKDLIDQFHKKGQGEKVDSWVAQGPNKSITARDLADALGADQIDQLAKRTGMSRDELLAELSRRLPEAIDTVTPHGRLPDAKELPRWG